MNINAEYTQIYEHMELCGGMCVHYNEVCGGTCVHYNEGCGGMCIHYNDVF